MKSASPSRFPMSPMQPSRPIAIYSIPLAIIRFSISVQLVPNNLFLTMTVISRRK
jgi:hypothetical protein